MKCSKCDKKIKEFSKFCHYCGNEIKEKLGINTNKGLKTSMIISIVFIVVVLLLTVSAIIIFAVPVSYEATEHYSQREPYTDYKRVCVDRSWWSGNCVDWDTQRVTKYRTVSKERIVTRTATPYQIWTNQVQWEYWV